jgi:alkylresorcinol/alkylpyrone synthase
VLDLDPARERRPGGDIATALFGDGAATAVITAGKAGSRRSSARPRNCGPTRSASWAGGSRTDLGVLFDRAIPPFIEANLAEAVDEMCAQLHLAREDISRFCCHPAG